MGGTLCLFSVRLQSPSCWWMESSGNRCCGPVWVEVRCKNVLFCQMEPSSTSYRCGGITTFHCEILVESWLQYRYFNPWKSRTATCTVCFHINHATAKGIAELNAKCTFRVERVARLACGFSDSLRRVRLDCRQRSAVQCWA